jgi:phage terminase large subunit-like protein
MATAALQSPPVRWSDCGRFWYDEATAEKAVAFFPQFLRFTKGEWAGRPFHLEPWEADDIIRPAFGWKRVDGTRRYRRIIVWVPRKNGKTELAAGVSLLALMGDNEAGAEVYSFATNEDQAKLVFDIATAMVGMSEPLSKRLETYKGAIFCPANMGSIKALTAKARGKHGLNPSGLIGDEIHEWADSQLYTFLHQGTAARRQPMEFLISTAGTRDGYGFELWQECQRIVSGDYEDDETLVVIFAADPEDDWTDPATWMKANPNYGVSVKADYLAAECLKAQESPRRENDFKRYHLNIWTEQAVRWLPMDAWDRGSAGSDWRTMADALVGRTCFAGLDLSLRADLTAYALVFPPIEGEPRWQVLVRAFVPEAAIEHRVRTDKVPYDRWIREGALTATPGNVIDYAFVKAALLDDATRYDIAKAALDPWNATQIAIQLAEEGMTTELIRQGFASLTAPSKELEALVLDSLFDTGGHPVARWCAGNVAVATDPAGNIKPDKKNSTERIDVIAAMVNALAVALQRMENTVSVYETRGLLVF